MVVGERPRVRQIEAAEATGMSVTLRVRPPRTASELEGRRSLKVKITKSACACEISALVTAAALMTHAVGPSPTLLSNLLTAPEEPPSVR
eukprot:scaffold54251_cov60-Phaeocystis_antarctica.AAC.2